MNLSFSTPTALALGPWFCDGNHATRASGVPLRGIRGCLYDGPSHSAGPGANRRYNTKPFPLPLNASRGGVVVLKISHANSWLPLVGGRPRAGETGFLSAVTN